MAVYEGRRICSSCRGVNLGRDKQCQGCGTPVTADVRYFLPDDAMAVQDATLLRHAASGAAWHCDHCDSINLNMVDGKKITNCRNCGDARDGEDLNRVQHRMAPGQDRASGSIVEGKTPPETRRGASASRPAPRPRTISSSGRGGVEALPRSSRSSSALYAVVTAIFAITLVGLIASLFVPVGDARVEIMHHHWERSQAVERLDTLQRSGFNPPSDARIHDREWRYSHTTQVIEGTERYDCGRIDNGNGFFSTQYCQRPTYRDEQVYDWHYRYEIDRWQQMLREVTRGTDDTPHWPVVRAHGPRQRLTPRHERYWIEIDLEGDRHNMTLAFDVWSSLGKDRDLTIPVNIWGNPTGSSEIRFAE